MHASISDSWQHHTDASIRHVNRGNEYRRRCSLRKKLRWCRYCWPTQYMNYPLTHSLVKLSLYSRVSDWGDWNAWNWTSRDLTTRHQIKQTCTIFMLNGILSERHLSLLRDLCVLLYTVLVLYDVFRSIRVNNAIDAGTGVRRESSCSPNKIIGEQLVHLEPPVFFLKLTVKSNLTVCKVYF